MLNSLKPFPRENSEFSASLVFTPRMQKLLQIPLPSLCGILASPSSFHLTFLHQSVARASRGSVLRGQMAARLAARCDCVQFVGVETMLRRHEMRVCAS